MQTPMRWTLSPKPDAALVTELAAALNVTELVARLLVQRGITTFDQAKDFFRPTLESLHDPYLMKDMDKAVARVERAIQNGECILVFGDYDVDGTTSVALVSTYLRSIYDKVDTYIPDRYDEGYGVSFKGIDYADDNGMTLIIALDCGVKSVAHVAYAKEKGIDFIICDHHRPGPELPDAVAVLDPKRDDCTYPYDELCGCGVGFKLVQALGANRQQGLLDLYPYLDLVATAIAADIVPITGENRVLAYYGLKVMNTGPRPGLKALLFQIRKKVIDISDVVFIVAPRINAAGRIRHGQHAVALLCETDFEQALAYAQEIEQYNADRKDLDKSITQQALWQIEENGEQERYTTVVFQEDWHKGVIGIVASRLIETYYRPTLVFTKSGDKYAASARSVSGFDVYNALESCAEHLEQFGGHMYAAGMTLRPEKYAEFKAAFEETVKATLPEALRVPEIIVDAEVTFNDLDARTHRILKLFEPFGPGNRMPVFLSRNVHDTGHAKRLGKNGEHLRLFVRQVDSEGMGAIAFGLGNRLEEVANRRPFAMIFCLEENEWNGTVTPQLRVKDIRQNF